MARLTEEDRAEHDEEEDSVSDQEVLDATKRFAAKDVKPFGIALKVPCYIIDRIQSEKTDPAGQAYEIYEHWKRNNGLPNESIKREKIAEALKVCNQGRAARKLTDRRDRTKTQHILAEDVAYQLIDDIFKELNSRQKVKVFGLALGLNVATVDTIMLRQQEHSDTVVAHTMFVEWKTNCHQHNDNTMETIFLAALDAVKPRVSATPTPSHDDHEPEVTFSPTNVTGIRIAENTPLPQQQETVPPEPPSLPIEPQPPTPPEVTGIGANENTPLVQQQQERTVQPPLKEATTCCTKCCWVLAALLLLLLLMELIFLVLTFTFKMEVTEVILVEDTIALPLPGWYKPPSLSLQLWGQEDTCVATVIVIKCDNIQKYTMPMSTPNIDYTYLTVGSSIVVSSKDNPNLNRPYPIWLFQTIHDAEAAAKDEFHGYNCQFPGRGVQCGQISTESSSKVIFNITQPSYYFLRCEQAPFNCSQIQHWDITETAFNFSIPSQLILYHVVVSAQNVTTSLRVRSDYFPSISSTEDICLLAQLNRGLCGSYDNKYFLELWYTSVFGEMAIYGIIPIGILLIALCIVIAFRCRGTNTLCLL